MQIEEALKTAIEFELDYIGKTGYWFDIKEFDME
jgi:hypothetical protein